MHDESPSISVCSVLGWGSVIVANVTVMVQPWILGGAIPLSRLTLQVGASAALGLSLIASAVDRRGTSRSVPWVLWILLGLAGIGVIQLLPVFGEPHSQLEHTVYAGQDNPGGLATPSTAPRSFSPGDTRLRIAQLFALGALLLALVDQVRTRRHLMTCLVLQVGNASCLSVIALLQLINQGTIIFGGQWIRSTTVPFATFVNPNNAAGWFCVQLAFVSILFTVARRGLVGASRLPHRQLQGQRSPMKALWQAFLSHLAGLDVFLLSILLSGILVLTASAATFSRGGILAAFCTVLVALRFGLRKRAVAWLVFLPVVAGAIGIVTLLQLDSTITDELSTLSDPLTAGSVRLRHWADSLRAVMDFPLIGCGLGAYQFATLPYQTIDINSWYRNADNQYVELLVESGLLGGVLLCVLFVHLFLLLRRVNRESEQAHELSNRAFTGRVVFQWLLMMLAGQVVSASFDFGIVLTATSSLVILGFGCCLAMLQRSRRNKSEVSAIGQMRIGGFAAFAVRLGVVVAAISMIPDVLAATRVYSGVLHAARGLRADDLDTLIQTLPDSELILFHSLRGRSDDSEGLMMAASLAEAEFRARLLKTQVPDGNLSGEEFSDAWLRTNPSRLAERLLSMRRAGDPGRARLERIMMQELGRSKLPAVQLAVLERLPLVPSLRSRYAFMLSWIAPEVQFRRAAFRSLKHHPASSADLYWLGRLSQLLGEWDDAATFWNQSLRAGISMRTAILTSASETVSAAEAVQLFGGKDYRETMSSVMQMRHPELRSELLAAAGSQWNEGLTGAEGFELWECRNLHLELTNRPAEALEWATAQMQFDSPRQEIRRTKAKLLEQTGEPTSALREWRHVLSMDPEATDAAAAVQRLRQPD